MAIIRKSELLQLSEQQIEDKLNELYKELMKFQTQRAIGTSLESPGKVKEIRRSIARLLTVRNIRHQKDDMGGKKKV